MLWNQHFLKCHLPHVVVVAGAETESHNFTQSYRLAWIKTPQADGFVMIKTYKNVIFLTYEQQKQQPLIYLRGFPPQSQALPHSPKYISSHIPVSLAEALVISHVIYPPQLQTLACKWEVALGVGYCASEFIWTDQKHNYALLAHNKPRLSGLENSFIYINSVVVRQ